MKGLDFSEICRQEVVRYIDNVAIIADTYFKRKLDASVNQINIETEAIKILKAKPKMAVWSSIRLRSKQAKVET
ncbi:hypothetical protein [Algibacter agarivorans]